MRPYFYFAIILFALSSCVSSKKITSDIESYENALSVIEKLNKKPESSKHWEKLAFHYANCEIWFNKAIKDAKESDEDFKWNTVLNHMNAMNSLTDSINKFSLSEQYIKPITFEEKDLQAIKVKAADECIKMAENLLKFNQNKMAHKMAIVYFKKALALNPSLEGLKGKIDELNTQIPE